MLTRGTLVSGTPTSGTLISGMITGVTKPPARVLIAIARYETANSVFILIMVMMYVHGLYWTWINVIPIHPKKLAIGLQGNSPLRVVILHDNSLLIFWNYKRLFVFQ